MSTTIVPREMASQARLRAWWPWTRAMSSSPRWRAARHSRDFSNALIPIAAQQMTDATDRHRESSTGSSRSSEGRICKVEDGRWKMSVPEEKTTESSWRETSGWKRSPEERGLGLDWWRRCRSSYLGGGDLERAAPLGGSVNMTTLGKVVLILSAYEGGSSADALASIVLVPWCRPSLVSLSLGNILGDLCYHVSEFWH